MDFSETFTPVAKFAYMRLLIATATVYILWLHQMDVVTPFLNPDVKEETYVKCAEGLGVPKDLQENEDTLIALRLKKGLYGLKKAPRL